jgi:hypothetical protein
MTGIKSIGNKQPSITPKKNSLIVMLSSNDATASEIVFPNPAPTTAPKAPFPLVNSLSNSKPV